MLLLVLLVFSVSTLANATCPNECYYEAETACNHYNDPIKCKLSTTSDSAVVCCHLTSEEIGNVLSSSYNFTKTNIQKLHLRNVTAKVFKIEWLNQWRPCSLAVTDGRIDEVKGQFPKTARSPCLNFSSNAMLRFDNGSLKYVQDLERLDLSNNSLSHIPSMRLGINLTLDISENKALQYNNLIETMKRYNITFVNANKTTCLLLLDTSTWLNKTESVSLTEVEHYYELKKNCTLENCSCEAYRWDFSIRPEATLTMMVDCSGKQLTSLPSPLPANTIALNISNNNKMEELFLKLTLVDYESEVITMVDNFLEFSNWLLNTVLLNRVLDTAYLRIAMNHCPSIIRIVRARNTCKLYNFEVLTIIKESVFTTCIRFCIFVIVLQVKGDLEYSDIKDVITRTKNMLHTIVSCKKLLNFSEITKEIENFIKYLVDYIASTNVNMLQHQITSLDAIRDDPSYGNLRELYADHNHIEGILPLLDSTKFIGSFVALSLRYNKLKTVPMHFLSNIFDRNDNFRYLNLGQNKLECDCNAAKVLKAWLITKQKHITDYEEIYCNNLDNKVIDLDPTKLCKTQQDWTDYIYYIITAEILLLVLLIVKVSYDYWVFKTAGYLPWPASKMPKLPCDWLCE